MNTALIIITILSLAFGIGMLVVSLRLMREQRRRSAARVEALLAAIAGASEQNVGLEASTAAPVPAASVQTEVSLDAAQSVAPSWRLFASSGRRSSEPRVAAAVVEDQVASLPLRFARTLPEIAPISPFSSTDLFQTSAKPAAGFRRLAVPVTIGVGIVGTILTGLALWNGHDAKPAASVANLRPANAASVPLELISLRHERIGDALSITGLVRNPAGGHPVSDINVIVFLFDRYGAFVTSAVKPLDFRTLAPGDESAFVVSLDKLGNVGRYRVSFRAHDTVVPHVDRRQEPIVAAAKPG